MGWGTGVPFEALRMRHSRTVFARARVVLHRRRPPQHPLVTVAAQEVQRVGDAGFLPHPLGEKRPAPGSRSPTQSARRVDVGKLDVAQEMSAYAALVRSLSTCSARSGFAASTSAYFCFAASRSRG